MSLISGEIPNEWRQANISPIHKNGSKLIASNYRPISLTSVVCKLLESIVKDKILQHLERNKLICPSQHGFIPKRSCTTNLLETLDFITNNLNEGANVDVIYLDFEKAFDKVSHVKLLIKLRSYGITELTIRWIESFLRNRKQRVHIRGKYSDWEPVVSGVPQGSVLGPLLFVVYINDLPSRVLNMCKMFADDSKLGAKIECIQDSRKLQDDLNNVVEWANEWQASFNTGKCRVVHYGKNNPQFDYSMAGIVLEKSTMEKDLGIMFSGDLQWDEQISKSINKANSALAQIKNSFTNLDVNIIKPLYKSLVRPHLEYAITVWNPYLEQDKIKLEKIQRRATKLVPSLRKTNYETRLRVFQLTSLEVRRERGDLIEFFKTIRKIEEINWIIEPRKIADGNDGYNLRRHNLHFYKEGTKCITVRENFFSNRVISLWDQLPDEARDATTLDGFKAAIDRVTRFTC